MHNPFYLPGKICSFGQGKYEVLVAGLSLWARPSKDSTLLGHLEKGSHVQITEECALLGHRITQCSCVVWPGAGFLFEDMLPVLGHHTVLVRRTASGTWSRCRLPGGWLSQVCLSLHTARSQPFCGLCRRLIAAGRVCQSWLGAHAPSVALGIFGQGER